ncbi:MAG: hypothetical protein IKH30_09250 [Clostridia bacterium]|nr:hypothetical protein [Clostridia bacterium]
MQMQIVPSLLYFLAAVILLFPLLRRTVKPRLVSAVLLLIPLILDFWYLIPQITNTLSPDVLLTASSAVKTAVSAFALIMSLKARKHSALPYREV